MSKYDKLLARIEALEQLTKDQAPEPEPWTPKAGDWVVCDKVPDNKSAPPGWSHLMNELIGKAIEVSRIGRFVAARGYAWLPEWLRPATPEEVAKAKREKEWEGITELQDDDYTEATQEVVDALDEMGFEWHGKDRNTFSGVRYLMGLGKVVNTWHATGILPTAEFLRRAKGTMEAIKAKGKAEELAKPIVFGTWVRNNATGDKCRIVSDGLDASGEAYAMKHDYPHCVYKFRREQFTVIDPPEQC